MRFSANIFRAARQLAAVLLCLAGVTLANAQDLSDRVLVVYNANSAPSRAVAESYLELRHIPRRHLCAIAPPAEDLLSWDAFNATVKNPIRNCLSSSDPERRIQYIVLTYATPFRIETGIPAQYYHPQGQPNAVPGRAADSYLIDLWDAYGLRENPYFVNADTKNNVYQDFQTLADFNAHSAGPPIYSVWRLDGPTPEIAAGLVEKALYAEANGLRGRACFDRNRGLFNVLQETDASYLATDWDMYRAAEFFRQKGWNTTEDFVDAEFGTAPAPPQCGGAAYYTGWYSYNNYNDVFSWVPGAIGFHIDSASAANPRGGANWAANALRRGITVTTGAVEEPFVRLFPKTDQIARYLLQGANVGDAFLRATLFKEWQFINLGDPLYRPFPAATFPVAPGLPRAWRHADIGTVGANGAAAFYAGNFEVSSSGAGLLNANDSLHLAYLTWRGDGDITARLARPENTSGAGYAAFAGVMLRQSLAADAPYVALGAAPAEGYRLLARTTAGAAGAVLQQGEHGAALWVRLTRRGNQIYAAVSPDGANWTQFGVAAVNFPATIYAGLALSSGAVDRRNQSFFDNVSVQSKPQRGGDDNPGPLRPFDSSGLFSLVWQRDENYQRDFYQERVH